nr:unnamed protein product [Spirometra erinaceieuropaei]
MPTVIKAPGSASPTGRTANSSTTGGCTSSRGYPQLLLFAAARDNFWLIINTEETVVMKRPPPNAARIAPQININDAQFQAMDNVTYLGSTSPLSIRTDAKVAR